jgi:hypothetical protein
LAATAAQWPPIALAYGWVHRAAHLLSNDANKEGAVVRATDAALRTELRRRRDEAGPLAPVIDHFLKVTDSDAPGLFHCYAVDGLPPTDNDREHVFGTARHHARRTTGRKVASPALVVRGAVRVVAAVATQQRQQQPGHGAQPFGEADLRLQRPADLARWRQLRTDLTHRQQARCAQRRFRRRPDAYLAALEAQLLQPSLPA